MDIKEIISKKSNKYYEANRDKVIERSKEYYKANKDMIREREREKIKCECGSIIMRNSKSRHVKSEKHINYINKFAINAE